MGTESTVKTRRFRTLASGISNSIDEELTRLDVLLAGRANDWWDSFYENRAKPCAFFSASPDESLANWIDEGLIGPGRAVELGCGNGRNAIFLGRCGFALEGVDYSRTAIAWAKERAREAGVQVVFQPQFVFEMKLEPGAFDLVYDSGCFHHIAPHRRGSYVELVTNALKPGGWFGLACFRPEGGSGHTDQEVYERRSMGAAWATQRNACAKSGQADYRFRSFAR